MALYHFICQGCGEATRRILEPSEVNGLTCKGCGAALKRDPQPPSTQVLERLDNGAMARRVERLSNAEQLYRDRANADPRKNQS